MGVEIERKFLVNLAEWKKLPKPEGSIYRQGYMLKESSKTIRIRVTDSQAYITIKGKSIGLSRSEYEYMIPIFEAEELLALFCNKVITKVRYRLPFAGKIWEVDVFSGENEGLIVAEIELDAEDEQFELPDWIGREVSREERYYNSNLSVHPYSKW